MVLLVTMNRNSFEPCQNYTRPPKGTSSWREAALGTIHLVVCVASLIDRVILSPFKLTCSSQYSLARIPPGTCLLLWKSMWWVSTFGLWSKRWQFIFRWYQMSNYGNGYILHPEWTWSWMPGCCAIPDTRPGAPVSGTLVNVGLNSDSLRYMLWEFRRAKE